MLARVKHGAYLLTYYISHLDGGLRSGSCYSSCRAQLTAGPCSFNDWTVVRFVGCCCWLLAVLRGGGNGDPVHTENRARRLRVQATNACSHVQVHACPCGHTRTRSAGSTHTHAWHPHASALTNSQQQSCLRCTRAAATSG